jgi:hypothetical protein
VGRVRRGSGGPGADDAQPGEQVGVGEEVAAVVDADPGAVEAPGGEFGGHGVFRASEVVQDEAEVRVVLGADRRPQVGAVAGVADVAAGPGGRTDVAGAAVGRCPAQAGSVQFQALMARISQFWVSRRAGLRDGRRSRMSEHLSAPGPLVIAVVLHHGRHVVGPLCSARPADFHRLRPTVTGHAPSCGLERGQPETTPTTTLMAVARMLVPNT